MNLMISHIPLLPPCVSDSWFGNLIDSVQFHAFPWIAWFSSTMSLEARSHPHCPLSMDIVDENQAIHGNASNCTESMRFPNQLSETQGGSKGMWEIIKFIDFHRIPMICYVRGEMTHPLGRGGGVISHALFECPRMTHPPWVDHWVVVWGSIR